MFFFCRNRKGKIIKAASFQASVSSGEVARVEPNCKWFGEFMVLVKENKCVCVCVQNGVCHSSVCVQNGV